MKKQGLQLSEKILVVTLMATIGLLIWVIYRNNNQPQLVEQPAAPATLPSIEKQSDLPRAAKALNAIDIDAVVDTSDLAKALE